jgi:beta-glucosidase
MNEKDKASELVAKLNLRKRAYLVFGHGNWHTYGLPSDGLPAVCMQDGPCGLRKAHEGEFADDQGSEKATCFPAPCLTACSWDPNVMSSIGKAVADEAIEQGVDIVLAPGVNIKRNPLCGRNFEYLSEEPLLAGKLGAAYINAVQSKGVGTSLKHFALNNQEYHRFTYSAEVDERAMREIYLKAFEIAVKESKPWTVMCSYNRINGVYASDNDSLLKGVLRTEWGYEGAVISDWGAVSDPFLSHNYGLDLEMPCFVDRSKALVKAMKKGTVSARSVSDSAIRVATLAFKAANKPAKEKAFSYGISHEIAKVAAEKSIVLLKNEGGVLPLKDYADCCLIGALADEPRYQGAGSSQVNPANLISFKIASSVGMDIEKELPYARGYSLASPEDDKALSLEAANLASMHSKVILFLGLPSEYESEGYDRSDMRLPDNQLSLFETLWNVNKNIIVILSLGAPAELPFAGKAKAIVLSYLAGEAAGQAVNDILLGRANPSGKLAESWPFHYLDVPSKEFFPGNGKTSLYKESIFVGYRYYLSAHREVLYPFGYGLSYSKFEYGGLAVSSVNLMKDEKVNVSFRLRNISSVAGEEIVQLYISAKNGKAFYPSRELRDFAKVSLLPGEEKTVSFSLPYETFAHYECSKEAFIVEDNDYLIQIGASCEDIKLTGALHVESFFKGKDLHIKLPSYYNLASGKDFHVSDSEFSLLLGRPLPKDKEKPHRPFTFNSTIDDLSHTITGKILRKVAVKEMSVPGKSPSQIKAAVDMATSCPLRMLAIYGIPERKVLALLDLANLRPFKALRDLQFGHRR